jgi:cytochrome P450 family 142 subfamily A polypeptide 1
MADHPLRDDIDLVAGSFYADDPHEKWAWMRANAPVYHDPNSEVWGVTRYDDLKAISKDAATFSNAGGIRPENGPLPMMIDMDDPEHVRRRKLVNKGFTPRRVRDSEARINVVCDAIIDRVCETGTCDFVSDIAAPLPMIMIGDALGVAPDDREDLLRWSDEMLSALTGHQSEEDMVKAATAFGDYTAYAQRVIEDRKSQPRDDLMSVLVHAEVDGDRLDTHSVVQESLLILVGGDETTRHVISGGMYQLLTHPDQQRAVVDDPSKLDLAVEEMLRWVSPIRNMARTATRDVEVRGQTIAEGQKLLLFYPSANRDESVFADPFTFDVERSPNEHVAFGFGSHFCLGNSLARLELKVMFERLIDRLPDLALVDEGEPANRAANFVSGYETMPVQFTPVAPVGAVA